MNRNEILEAGSISAIVVRVSWAEVELLADDVKDIQLIISGTDEDVGDISLTQQDGKLRLEQTVRSLAPRLNGIRWIQIMIRVPKDWKGSAEVISVSGDISLRGLTGTDMTAETVSGRIHATDLECITLCLQSVSGTITGSSLWGDTATVKSASGSITLHRSAFRRYKLTEVSGETEIEMAAPFEDFTGNTVSGDVRLTVPMAAVDSRVKTVSGRIRTSGVSLADGAPRLSLAGVSAGLEIIASQQNSEPTTI